MVLLVRGQHAPAGCVVEVLAVARVVVLRLRLVHPLEGESSRPEDAGGAVLNDDVIDAQRLELGHRTAHAGGGVADGADGLRSSNKRRLCNRDVVLGERRHVSVLQSEAVYGVVPGDDAELPGTVLRAIQAGGRDGTEAGP